jgi:hypothetical protein
LLATALAASERKPAGPRQGLTVKRARQANKAIRSRRSTLCTTGEFQERMRSGGDAVIVLD